MQAPAAPSALRIRETRPALAPARGRAEAPAGSGSIDGIGFLHATAGNHAVESLFRRSGVLLQRKARPGVKRSQPAPSARAAVSAVVNGGGGRRLDSALRSILEHRFEADLGDVRVHADSRAAASAGAVNALAYTVGPNIVFGEGQYAPYAPGGFELLAHEVAHTLQQRRAQGLPGEAEARTLEAEAGRAGEAVARGEAPARPASGPTGVQRTPDPDSLANAPDPIDDVDFPDYGMHLIAHDYDHPPDVNEIRAALASAGVVSQDVLGECTAGQFHMLHSDHVYWSFRHPTLGVVARAMGKASTWGPTSDQPIGYGVYVYQRFQPKAGTVKVETTLPSGGRGQAKPAPAAKKTAQAKALEKPSQASPAARPPSGQAPAPKPGGQAGAEAKQASKDAPDPEAAEREKLLKDWPEWLRSQAGLRITPDQYDQVRRITGKLKALSPEDLELLHQVANILATDLDVMEQSLAVFQRVKSQVRAQFQGAQGKRSPGVPAGTPADETLEEKLGKTFDSFDESKFGAMTRGEKEQLAASIAAEQRNIILKHAVTHPGETVAGMVEGLDVNKVSQEIAGDIQEALSGDANGWARAAAVAGAFGKSSGWIAGVAGLFAILLLFVPGANVAEIVSLAIAAGLTSMVLTAAEADLRIKAAGAEKDPEKYKQHITKAGAAQASFAIQAALLATGFAAKLIAKIPLPGRLQNVGNALKTAGSALSKRTGTAFESVRAELLAKLRAAKPGLKQALAKEAKGLVRTAEVVEKLTGEEFLDRLAKGDPALKELDVPPEQARALQEAARQTPGSQVPEQVRKQVLRDLQDAPEQARGQVENFERNVEQTIDEVRAARTEEDLRAAVAKAEERFSPEKVAREAEAQKQNYVQERAAEEAFRDLSDEQVRAAARTDPAAVDELLRRYRGKTVKELQRLKRAGDATAEYELASRKQRSGYKKPVEMPARPSNLEVLNRLRQRLKDLRARMGHDRGTLLTAETDLALEKTEFEAGSPKTGAKPDPTYKPPSEHGHAQGHAEQNLVGELKREILKAKPDLAGRKIYVVVEQEVCPTCKAGLYGESAGAGVLKQFSTDFPELTIEIVNLESSEVIRIRGGELVK